VKIITAIFQLHAWRVSHFTLIEEFAAAGAVSLRQKSAVRGLSTPGQYGYIVGADRRHLPGGHPISFRATGAFHHQEGLFMSSQTTLLVTGANGCIGSWVMKLAMDKGWQVAALDLADTPTRPRLLLSDEQIGQIKWVSGDLSDTATVKGAVRDTGANAVVHLGALQVPFCKADPVAGAQVNVVGTANVLEAVREAGIKRFSFASSIAAMGGASEDNPYLGTLYGAYKAATEEMARVYWQDWQVPSVCLRPGVVYGVGRDQGMTSAPTKAMLAAVMGRSYTIPFGGRAAFLYVGEVAGAFLKAVETDIDGFHLFDLNGEDRAISDMVDLVAAEIPGADLKIEGDQLPFPPYVSDEPIQAFLGDYGQTQLEAGVSQTIAGFRRLADTGLLDLSQLER
jgi:nucleoside-diphosphate-sugar epimerase